MASTIWEQVLKHDLTVPAERPLVDLTAELVSMLGSTDPVQREGTALRVLATWIERGVYDDLLIGLGDGMADGLAIGLGESGTDTIFRRSFSARVLGHCIDRGIDGAGLLSAEKVLEWGDRLAGWYVREQDLRGHLETKGWARAVAHGADAVGALAGSPYFGTNELTVLLDVLADRLLIDNDALMVWGETDRMAQATSTILGRDLVPLTVLRPWVSRIAHAAVAAHDTGDACLAAFNAQSFLRSLYLKVAFSTPAPQVRADLLLELIDHLRTSNPRLLGSG